MFKKGYKQTEEHKKKIGIANSIALKGKIFPHLFQKGCSPWNKNIKTGIKPTNAFQKGHPHFGFKKGEYKHSLEIRKKISIAKKGHIPWIKGKHIKLNNALEIWRKNGGKVWNKGMIGIFVKEKSANWQGGISFELYTPLFTQQLRDRIRVRDNFICQLCGIPELECNTRLTIHHIDYDKKNCKEDNLTSLCKSCHGKTIGKNREYWKNVFSKKDKILL